MFQMSEKSHHGSLKGNSPGERILISSIVLIGPLPRGTLLFLRKMTSNIDQVLSEVWVDKIAALGLWTFFSSYVCKL